MNKNEIIAFLKKNRNFLRKKFGVKKIALFGSYARDENQKDSDIDILVDMKPSFDIFFDLKYYLENNLKKKVDLGLEKNLRVLVKENIKDDLIYV